VRLGIDEILPIDAPPPVDVVVIALPPVKLTLPADGGTGDGKTSLPHEAPGTSRGVLDGHGTLTASSTSSDGAGTSVPTSVSDLADQLGAPGAVPTLADLGSVPVPAALPTTSATLAPPSPIPTALSQPGRFHVPESLIDIPLDPPTNDASTPDTTSGAEHTDLSSIQPDDSLATAANR
jgi:hypothetical protein